MINGECATSIRTNHSAGSTACVTDKKNDHETTWFPDIHATYNLQRSYTERSKVCSIKRGSGIRVYDVWLTPQLPEIFSVCVCWGGFCQHCTRNKSLVDEFGSIDLLRNNVLRLESDRGIFDCRVFCWTTTASSIKEYVPQCVQPPVQYDHAPLQPVQHQPLQPVQHQPVQQQPPLQQQQPSLQPLQQQHQHYPQQIDQQQQQYAPYPPQYGYQNMQTQPQHFQTPPQQQQQEFQNQQDQQQQQYQTQQHFQPQQQKSPSDSTPGLGNDSLSTVGSVANVSLSTVGSVVSTVSVPPARIEKKENLGKMTNKERNKQRSTMLKKEFGEWWSRRDTRRREYPGSRPNFDMSKDHEVMETVGGRLAIVGNMTKYTLTVEELRRRIEGAESMNISELNCLFRKGKKKNGGEDLRRTLWDSYGIEIKNSQRHSILQSKFTPILEGEARVMANDVDQMTKQHFPTDPLSEMIYEYMLNVTTPIEMLKQVKGCLNTLERIIDVANSCKPKIVGEMEYKSGFDPLDEKMEFYSNRTHCFGVVNMNGLWRSTKQCNWSNKELNTKLEDGH